MKLTVKEFKRLAWIINANLGTPEETAEIYSPPEPETAEPEMVTEDNYKKVFAGLGFVYERGGNVIAATSEIHGLSFENETVTFWIALTSAGRWHKFLELPKRFSTIPIVTILAEQLQKF